MPRKDGSLTIFEERFLEHFSKFEDRRAAEKHAGLRENGGYEVLARPEILRQITARQSAILAAEGAPIAVRTLVSIMESKRAPASARVQAAKIVLDRAMPNEEAGREKQLHEMTPEEIAERIARLEGMAAARARDVTAGLEGPDATPQGGIFE